MIAATLDAPAPTRITLKKLAQREGVHYSTVLRWSLKGCRGRKLRTHMLGARKCTTEEDLAIFIRECGEGSAEQTKPTTTRKRRSAMERALDQDRT
jgi:hypothetical protein